MFTRQRSHPDLLALGFVRQREGPSIDFVEVERGTFRVFAASPAMDTLVSVTAIGPSRGRLEDAVEGAFREMRRLVGIFSRFDRDAALFTLNDAGRLHAPPPELVHVIERALRYHAATRGAFDVSVAPLVDLFRTRLTPTLGAAPRPPSEAEVREARSLLGCDAVRATSRELHLDRTGMRLTLDGIAKGYIVDRMCAVLDARRVRNYAVDGGGDVRTRGGKPGRRPWVVAVKDPDGGVRDDVLQLRNAAVATSGSYERFFDAGRRWHHIVNGDTGASPAECASVSVLADTTMVADALATSVFVMGPERGLAFVEATRGCECLVIDRTGRALRSSGWPGVRDTASARLRSTAIRETHHG